MDRATALKATYKAGRRGGDSIARAGIWIQKNGTACGTLGDFLGKSMLERIHISMHSECRTGG